MKVYDEVLKREELVHEQVAPDAGVELRMEDPESFKKIFAEEKEGEENVSDQ